MGRNLCGTKSVWDEICQNFHVRRNLFGTKSVTTNQTVFIKGNFIHEEAERYQSWCTFWFMKLKTTSNNYETENYLK